jgi:hypothetical protein
MKRNVRDGRCESGIRDEAENGRKMRNYTDDNLTTRRDGSDKRLEMGKTGRKR